MALGEVGSHYAQVMILDEITRVMLYLLSTYQTRRGLWAKRALVGFIAALEMQTDRPGAVLRRVRQLGGFDCRRRDREKKRTSRKFALLVAS